MLSSSGGDGGARGQIGRPGQQGREDPEGAEQGPLAKLRDTSGLTQLSNYLTSKGSFSALSKPNFASKYALELGSIWKALAEIYTMHSFAPFSMLKIFVKNRWKFANFFAKFR